MSIILKIKEKLINAFYPKHIKCICCKDELLSQNVYDMCDKCYENLPFIRSNFCARCGLKFEKDGTGLCLNCKANNFDFELARSALVFDGKVIPVIHKFKYARYKFLAEPLSYLLYDVLMIQNWKIDLICYVPLYLKRERMRGYNQSQELAKYLSKFTSIPIFDDIVRLRDTPTQTQLSR
ncbi:MAG: ComF family protein, partial [Clostridia bacterium]|nr:ComF family protein [Clostridia bacterium]